MVYTSFDDHSCFKSLDDHYLPCCFVVFISILDDGKEQERFSIKKIHNSPKTRKQMNTKMNIIRVMKRNEFIKKERFTSVISFHPVLCLPAINQDLISSKFS